MEGIFSGGLVTHKRWKRLVRGLSQAAFFTHPHPHPPEATDDVSIDDVSIDDKPGKPSGIFLQQGEDNVQQLKCKIRAPDFHLPI